MSVGKDGTLCWNLSNSTLLSLFLCPSPKANPFLSHLHDLWGGWSLLTESVRFNSQVIPVKICLGLYFWMGNWSRQKLNNSLKATEDVCVGADIWIAVEQQLCSVNNILSVVSRKKNPHFFCEFRNMAILLYSAFWESRSVPNAWQNCVPPACFSVVLLPNGWDLQAEGLTENALSVAVSC